MAKLYDTPIKAIRRNCLDCTPLYGLSKSSIQVQGSPLLGLGNITGEDVRETADTGIFVSYTLPHMDITNDDGSQL